MSKIVKYLVISLFLASCSETVAHYKKKEVKDSVYKNRLDLYDSSH